MQVCELMPRQAKIADQFALIRNMRFNCSFHQPFELLTGNPEKNPSLNSAIVANSPLSLNTGGEGRTDSRSWKGANHG
jgi:hypothetical protein